MGSIAYIGIGSNLGDRLDNCKKAMRLISELKECKIIAQSSFYETEPFGNVGGDWFINCVVKIETKIDANELLLELLGIELKMGRIRLSPKGPRNIDLDLLFYDDKVIDDPDLQIPHKGISEKRFVLVPLYEIAPDFIHPVEQVNISAILNKLNDNNKVIKI